MVFGPPFITSNLPPMSASSYKIQRASEAKLLGVHIDSNISWHTQVEAIVSKATQRLYFLKQLKRAGVPHAQLLHFYISVIRLVLEYAVPVWHHLLTKTQTDSIESVQKRALCTIYSFSNDFPYCNTKFHRIPTRTKKYQSFVSYVLSRYQTQILSSPLLPVLGCTLHLQ